MQMEIAQKLTPVELVLSADEQAEFLESLRKYLSKWERVMWWNRLVQQPGFYRDIPGFVAGEYVAIGGKYGYRDKTPLKVIKGMENTHQAYVVARLAALKLDLFNVQSGLGVYWQVSTLKRYEEGEGIY